MPCIRDTQKYYLLFHQECFDAEGHFSQEKFDNFEHRDLLCQFPLYDSMFIWSVLFLWSSTCFMEIRRTQRIFTAILALPNLPETAGPDDMITKLDSPEEAD